MPFTGVMEVDILEFQVPVENNKTLFVWDIQPSHTEAQIYVSPPGGQVCVSPPGGQVCVSPVEVQVCVSPAEGSGLCESS